MYFYLFRARYSINILTARDRVRVREMDNERQVNELQKRRTIQNKTKTDTKQLLGPVYYFSFVCFGQFE